MVWLNQRQGLKGDGIMFLETPTARTREKPPEQMPKQPTGTRDYLLALLAACGMLGPALYIVTWTVAGLLYPGYNQLTQATSELSSKAAPPAAAAIANFGGYALGLLLIAFALGLYRGVRRSRWLLIGAILVGLFGVVCVIQPFFPMDPGATSLAWQNVMHDAVYVISGVALIPGLLILSVAFAEDPSLRLYRWYTLITPLLILLAGVDVGLFPAGVPERLSTLALLIWFEVVAFRLLRLAFHREPKLSV
jgi:hypothetical membrane protein